MVKGKLQIPRSGANKKISAANKHSTASLAVHIFQLLKPTATAVPSYTTCGTVVTDDRYRQTDRQTHRQTVDRQTDM